MRANKEVLDKLRKKYGKKFFKSFTAVIKRRVYKYIFEPSNKVVWIVYSPKRKRRYIVIPDVFCSCEDFYLNVIIRGKKEMCYHMLAQKIANITGMYSEKRISDKNIKNFYEKLFLSILTKKSI